MSSDTKSEPELKDQPSPDNAKQASKKRKPGAGGTHRRTKTGCLTCRQRRVKCDEMKPTCRNCEKSRRQCAGYQASTLRAQLPMNPSMQTPPHYMPHAGIPQSSVDYFHPLRGTGSASRSPFSPEVPPPQFGTPTMLHDSRYGYEWPAADNNFAVDQSHMLIGHEWVHNPMAGPPTYAYSMQHGRFADMRPSMSSVYPDSSYPQTVQAHRSASSQSQHPPIDDYEDPDDPWDVDTNDEFSEQEALINFTTPRSLILDERKAYMLKHFVTFLRPCISIYERPLAFDGSSTFAEVLPTLALSCRGLLHGIMAISALHMAILHRTSEVIPLKHFVIASKKLAKLISFQPTRHKLDTLSLCLGLAFYEVLLGDHARWVLHLRGAAALLLEHDYAGFVRASRRMRAHAKERLAQPWIKHEEISWQEYVGIADIPAALLPDDEWEIDEVLVCKLTGLNIDYANQVQDSAKSTSPSNTLSQDEVKEWRTKLDLLFWYLKMDVFQSILSGDGLLIPYKNWKYFPPRGQLGLTGNAHATMDYLWLILGRLAEFGSKDRARKLRKASTTGGVWKPHPDFLTPQGGNSSPTKSNQKQLSPESSQKFAHAPNANEGRTRVPKLVSGSSGSRKGPPLFWGMMPPPKIPASMLSSFHITDAALCGDAVGNEQTMSASSATTDMVTATKEALAEHAAISQALSIWRQSLSQEFEPLPAYPSTPGAPFTPSLRYRDPMIACVWSLYHLAKILLRRYHPHSPPAMLQSAGVNANFTAEDADAIGRINAGLLENQAELARAGSINPTLVAALQELTFPLMFAGVQFQDSSERAWAINSLLELSNGSGWRTAYSVASALEASWEGQNNYTRTLAKRSPNEAGKYDRKRSNDKAGASSQDEHESRFVNHDRSLIDRFSDIRAFWAVGVLSSSEDLSKVMGRMTLDRS